MSAPSRPLVVGFVCEGSTDLVVLRRIIEQVLDREVDSRALQPQTDALDRQRPGGGWSEVRAWCQRQDQAALDLVMEPLVGDALDALVIAIDLDIAIAAGIAKAPTSLKAYDAKALCNIVKSWLPTKLPSAVLITIPVMAVEAWVIAALFPKWKSPQHERDPAMALVERGKLELAASGKPWKRAAEYREFAEQVARRLKHCREQCSELERFAKKVEHLAGELS